MSIMEPISFAFGVVPLFHSCLEYFQLFKTAQSATLDVQVLLFQLDCHHEDLIIWGEKHGFFTEAEPQAPMSRDVFSRLETGLRLLETLFKDSSALYERYGVVVSNGAHEPATTDQDRTFPSSAGLRRLNWWKMQKANPRNNSGGQSVKPSLGVLQKTRWAISDKGKFEGLVKKIGDLVSQVEKILPVLDDFRNQTALRDILPLIDDLSRLKLFQTASASIRPAWANAASGLIIASEAASVRGPGTISRWIEQVEDGAETNIDGVNPLPPQDGARLASNGKTGNEKPKEPIFKFQMESLWSLWFAFLPTCPSLSLGLSCDTMFLELGKDCPAFIGEDDSTKKWGLGPKIKLGVKKNRDVEKLEATLEKVSNLSYEMQEKLADLMEPISAEFRPSSIIHIYCAPCRCAVRTALILCRQNLGDKTTSVRIDDRIPSACCDAQRILQQLRSFITTINARELAQTDLFPTDSNTKDVDYIDKEWVENRIYTLESALYDGEGYGDRFKCINNFLNDVEKDEGMHSVVLLEASGGAWILQTPPFRKSPLMPKQLEVFNYGCPRSKYSWELSFTDTRIYRGTFTPSKLNFPEQDLENSRKRQRRD